MAGLNGRDVTVGFARSNTWGVPASVTKGLNLRSLDGWEGKVNVVVDEGFNQDFVGEGQPGDYSPTSPELTMDLRYDGPSPILLAAAMGSASAPTVVSSVAANSLIAYQHYVYPAADLTHFFTFAADFGGVGRSNFVAEIPTAKVRGFSVRVGENGKMQLALQTIGSKTNYTSTTNTSSTLAIVTSAALGNRVFRAAGTFYCNAQAAGSVVAAVNVMQVREVTFGASRPLADGDYIFGQDYIIEADDDGFAEFPVELTFPRMTSANANSLVRMYPAGTKLKASLQFYGNNINSVTPYSFSLNWPALEILEYAHGVTGHGQVRPSAKCAARMADAAPTGMSGTWPVYGNVINMNSANLLA